MLFSMHGAHISCDSTEDLFPSAYHLHYLYSIMHYEIRLAQTAGGYIQMQLAVIFRDGSDDLYGNI
jgi:TPP-dependent trihydroxycyclohexane-1,2-dione (THcHDO) dehydratase